MPLYQYVKAPPDRPTPARPGRAIPLWRRLIPLSMFVAGLGALSYVAWPIVSYQFIVAPSYRADAVARPISDEYVIVPANPQPDESRPPLGGDNPLYPAVALASEPQVLDNPFDLTNPANWFPGAPTYTDQTSAPAISTIKEYSITIPKIGVEDARVVIGGDDLSQYMIHYGGTALPGDFGNAVVFCHSTLPQFFDPNDYKTICSTLPGKVEKGDEIFVDVDGIKYRFVVNMISVVDPDNFTVLEQQYNRRSLTLITCVPPGTKWKRLVVRAELVPD